MNKSYVVVYSDGALAGKDIDSGGYPFRAVLPDGNYICFYTEDQKYLAEDYVKTNPGLELKEFHWEVK